MPGSHYIALSGLRARLDELDRLAADIANVGTSGYKSERAVQASAERPSFDAALQTAIDTTSAGTRLDMTEGAFLRTDRPLDMAIDGPGLFVLAGPTGDLYTRNGNFTVNAERELVTQDGMLVRGEDGPITIPDGEIRVDKDGSVWGGETLAGRIKVVEFADPSALTRGPGTRLIAPGQQAQDAAESSVRGGSLEQSNVSMAEQIAHLTTVSRGFQAMQKAISTVMNDVDGQAIAQLGRR